MGEEKNDIVDTIEDSVARAGAAGLIARLPELWVRVTPPSGFLDRAFKPPPPQAPSDHPPTICPNSNPSKGI